MNDLFFTHGEIIVSGAPGRWDLEAGEGQLRVKTWEEVQAALKLGPSWIGEMAIAQSGSDQRDTESLVFKGLVNQGWTPTPDGGFTRAMADNLDWLVKALDGALGWPDSDAVTPDLETDMGLYSGELVRKVIEGLIADARGYSIESSIEFPGIDNCYTVEVKRSGEIVLYCK